MNKKVLLSLASLAVATILTGGLTSCSGDDDSYTPTPIIPDKNGNNMLVTGIGNIHFAYDENGKLMGMSDGKTNVVTQDGKLVFNYNDITAYAYVNSDGLLTKVKYNYREIGYNLEGEWVISYSDRKLKSCRISETESGLTGNYKANGKIDYTWHDGNLTQANGTITGSGKANGKSINVTEVANVSFNYGNQVNSTKQFPLYMGREIAVGRDISGLFSAIGLLGYGPANLPTGYTKVDGDNGVTSARLSFKQNSNGTLYSETLNNSSTIYYNYGRIESRAEGSDIKSLEQCVRSLTNHLRHNIQ